MRQMGGFTAITSTHFCSCCKLLAKDIENFDMSSWEPRDSDLHHRTHATEWLNAKTMEDRKAAFEKYSVRWSALLELPYWRAIEYTTIDSMHAFWINSLLIHLEQVWGMDPEATSSEGFLLPVTKNKPSKRASRPDNLQMREGLEIIFEAVEINSGGSNDTLIRSLTKNGNLKPAVVFYLCFDHDIRRAGSKYMQLAQFVKWVRPEIKFTVAVTYSIYYQHKQHTGQLQDDLHSRYPPPKPSNADLLTGLALISTAGLDDPDLRKVAKSIAPAVLYHLCQDHDINRGSNKRTMAENLLQWVNNLSSFFVNTFSCSTFTFSTRTTQKSSIPTEIADMQIPELQRGRRTQKV